MIAVDTNLLVYAYTLRSRDHRSARAAVESLAGSDAQWGLPWPVAHEFVRVVTLQPPAPVALGAALGAIARLLESPGCLPLAERRGHWSRVSALAERGDAAGTRFYDARIAAICLDHGVRELWTADRDFGRFPDLRVVNPLVG